jgi:hypothetical protein
VIGHRASGLPTAAGVDGGGQGDESDSMAWAGVQGSAVVVARLAPPEGDGSVAGAVAQRSQSGAVGSCGPRAGKSTTAAARHNAHDRYGPDEATAEGSSGCPASAWGRPHSARRGSGRRPVEQLVEGDPVRSLSGVASTERESHDSTLRWTPPPLDELDGTGHVPTIRQR